MYGRERLVRAVAYLLLKKVAGNNEALLALFEYSSGGSLKEVAERHGYSKTWLQSNYSRIARALNNYQLASHVIRIFVPEIVSMKISWVEISSLGRRRCSICGKIFYGGSFPESHFWGKHREMVLKLAEEVVEKSLKNTSPLTQKL